MPVTKPDSVNRYLLPIHDRQHIGLTTYDAKDPDTDFPPITEVHPPEGSPNVLIILLDDIGFGAASTFGGATSTPTGCPRIEVEQVPHHHTLCPSRQALLTGRKAATLQTRYFSVPGRLVNRSGTPTLRGPTHRPWAASFTRVLTKLRAIAFVPT
jgi:hypothetical protein